MTGPTENSGKKPPRRTSDYRVKLGFLAVGIAVAAGAYFHFQRGGAILKNWPTDLDKVLKQAKAEDRQVLALFISSPPGQVTHRMARTTLKKPQNKRAIVTGRFLRVKVTVETLKSDLARRYRIRKLPTMLILSPGGQEQNRREGMIGEVPFRQGFLDGKEVQPPPK